MVEKKNFIRKAGRTLLVRTDDDFDPSGYTGVQSHHQSEKNGHTSYFLTFDNTDHSLEALRSIRKQYDQNVRVKFAYYKIYFRMEGLDESSSYEDVKTQHRDFVHTNTSGNVLYYRLYRKNDQFMGSGEMTLDTKQGFDELVSSNSNHKQYSLECGVTGTHYRYNRRSNEHSNQDSNHNEQSNTDTV
jgi:hypothetical protein